MNEEESPPRSRRAPRLLGDALLVATFLLGIGGVLCAVVFALLAGDGKLPHHQWSSSTWGETVAADLLLLAPPLSVLVAIGCAVRWLRLRRSGSLGEALLWLFAIVCAVLSTPIAFGLLALENWNASVPIH